MADFSWLDSTITQDGNTFDLGVPSWEWQQQNVPIDLNQPNPQDFNTGTMVGTPEPTAGAQDTGEFGLNPNANLNIPAPSMGGEFGLNPNAGLATGAQPPQMTQQAAQTAFQQQIQSMGQNDRDDLDAASDRIGISADGKLVYTAAAGADKAGKPVTPGSGDSVIDKALGVLGKVWADPGGKMAMVSLGLGAVGMLAGQLFAPTPPKLQTPTPVQSPAQQIGTGVLAGALNAPAGAPSSLTGSLAGGPGTVPGTGGAQNLAQFAPRGIAADLTSNVQNAVAGQRTISDAALGAAGRELLAQQEQAPGEREARLQALQDVRGLQGPTANLAPTLASGLMFGNATQNTLNAAPQPGQTIAPALYEDPIRIAMARQLEHVLGGDLPTPELDRQFKEEELALRNQLLRSNGPGYATSSVGIETLQRMRESQQIRREQYKMQVINTLGGQQQSRRQFDITQPEAQFQGRLANFAPNELQRAQFAENVQANRMNQAQGIAGGFGRQPLANTATTLTSAAPTARELLGLDQAGRSAEQANQLQNQAALEAFKAGGQNAANTASGIAGLFTGAAGAAIGASRPMFTLAPGTDNTKLVGSVS
jgi:hypothetical protein